MVERRLIAFFAHSRSGKWAATAAIVAVASVLVVAWPRADDVQAHRNLAQHGLTNKKAVKAAAGPGSGPASKTAQTNPRKSVPTPLILNKGSVDEDPARLALATATQLEDALPAVTADDDLDPAGTLTDWFNPDRDSYRTVCVRLCDGAITPISFATTRDRFQQDARRCDQSCSSASRLYVQRNPGTDAEHLVDLAGRTYGTLETAFRFRTSYDAACTCRAHAWETLSQARHRLFAIRERIDVARSISRGRVTELKLAAAKASAPETRLAARLAAQHSAVAAAPPQASELGPKGPSVGSTRAADLKSNEGKPAGTKVAGQNKLAGQKSAKRHVAKPKPADGPVRVFFNATIEGSARPIRKSGHARQAEFSPNRRFDGTDWRMHAYEPL